MADSQPDLTEFFKLSRPKRPPCRVGHARAQLKPEDVESLDAALATDKGLITASAIIEWLKGRGQGDVSVSAVSTHRKGACTCADAG